MFEINDVRREMIDRLYQECWKLKEGDILTHEMIRPILGCEPNVYPWQHCVDEVRDRLNRPAPEGRGIATLPVKPIGYRLLTASEAVVDVPTYRDKKKMSQDRRLCKSLSNISTEGLSVHERRLRLFVIEQAKARQSNLRRQIKERRAFLQPTPVQPLRLHPVQQAQREAVAQ